jgi:hypothetical protein
LLCNIFLIYFCLAEDWHEVCVVLCPQGFPG